MRTAKVFFKNFEQHFRRLIKIPPNLCTKYTERFKNFGRRDEETDKNGCFHGTLASPS